MSYTERFTLKVSDSVALTAAKVGKAFDPDSGGEFSFSKEVVGHTGMTPVYGNTLSTSTPCDAEFKATADYLMTNPVALHQALMQKYAERWKDLTPPTLAECEAFINAIIPEVKTPI